MLAGRVPVQRLLHEQGLHHLRRGVVEELRIVRESRLQRELAESNRACACGAHVHLLSTPGPHAPTSASQRAGDIIARSSSRRDRSTSATACTSRLPTTPCPSRAARRHRRRHHSPPLNPTRLCKFPPQHMTQRFERDALDGLERPTKRLSKKPAICLSKTSSDVNSKPSFARISALRHQVVHRQRRLSHESVADEFGRDASGEACAAARVAPEHGDPLCRRSLRLPRWIISRAHFSIISVIRRSATTNNMYSSQKYAPTRTSLIARHPHRIKVGVPDALCPQAPLAMIGFYHRRHRRHHPQRRPCQWARWRRGRACPLGHNSSARAVLRHFRCRSTSAATSPLDVIGLK